MALFFFWFSVFMVFYVYLGYPIVVMLISLILNKKVDKKPIEPSVTILISAYNEAEHITQTIQNKLDLDYPEDKLDIIVISDESTDGTDDLVKAFDNPRIQLFRQEPRAGKTSALNMAVPHAKGEILVFSDANSIYDQYAVRALMANFNDKAVGYVSGKMVYVNPDGSLVGDGCSAYMKYENWLRAFETKVGSIVGVDGGIDAVRKNLYDPMRADQLPDFVLPLKVTENGYRVIYEPEALLKEDTLKETADEYKMRVRVSLRAVWALFDMRGLLAFKKGTKLFSWQLWSHKVMRYGCFVFILTALLANLFLFGHGSLYVLSFSMQMMLVVAIVISFMVTKPGNTGKILNFSQYFFLLNVASAHAVVKFLWGQKMVVWSPRKG
ncbi:Glycosyltransferase, CESA-like subfamily [Desulfosarcina cetonica]|uniref:glycosyltransferase family 2 protein n=1 Tax=Desulfosarcina cetonica TaxID=90730 RepID=UPI0006CF4484|nr:glycosyltransferase family 2 protein [Desulfosarcina cetonica]VTR64149.1 Glycosyltransferase, CESA-like subfamily [Desulfosarcina cetonica]